MNMAGDDRGNFESEKGRPLPALPGEKLAKEERPIFVPKTNEGPVAYNVGERTEMLVVYHEGRALAMYHVGGHDDLDDPINIDKLVEGVRDVIRRSGLAYEVGEYFLKVEEGHRLEPVKVLDSEDLGVGYISEYQGGDGFADE